METEYESITKYKKWVRGKPQKACPTAAPLQTVIPFSSKLVVTIPIELDVRNLFCVNNGQSSTNC